MPTRYVKVALSALFGVLLGLILFMSQPTHAIETTMNPLGVVAFGSLGASVGCLVVGDHNRRRR